jgi:hypothetical protein
MHHGEPSTTMVALCFAVSILFVLGATFVAVMNWACVIASERNKRKGIDQHHSMVPVVSLVLGLLGLFFFPFPKGFWILIIPLADLSLWNLLFFPFFIIAYYWKKKSRPHGPMS